MRPLERLVRCGGGAAKEPPAQRPESIEAGAIPISEETGLAHVLLDRLHPGGVVEASDVRGDERREHRPYSIPGSRGFAPTSASGARARHSASFSPWS